MLRVNSKTKVVSIISSSKVTSICKDFFLQLENMKDRSETQCSPLSHLSVRIKVFKRVCFTDTCFKSRILNTIPLTVGETLVSVLAGAGTETGIQNNQTDFSGYLSSKHKIEHQ